MTRALMVVSVAVVAAVVVGVGAPVSAVLATVVAEAAAGIQRTLRSGAVCMLPLAIPGRALPLPVAGGMRWRRRGTTGQPAAVWTCHFPLSRRLARAAACWVEDMGARPLHWWALVPVVRLWLALLRWAPYLSAAVQLVAPLAVVAAMLVAMAALAEGAADWARRPRGHPMIRTWSWTRAPSRGARRALLAAAVGHRPGQPPLLLLLEAVPTPGPPG